MKFKVEDIDIDYVGTLTELYSILDQHALELAKDHDTTDLLLKYKNKTSSDEEKQMLQWEVEAFLYSFHGRRVFSFSTSNGKEAGEVSEYPKLDTHQKGAFDYISERAKKSKSSLLKARYNHLLWSSIVQKNRVFAAQASNNYIIAIEECLSVNNPPDSDWSYFISQLFENLVGISDESKINVQPVKDLTHTLLFQSPTLNFWAKHGIVDDMLKHTKIFKADDFAGTLELFEEHIKKPKTKTDDFWLVHNHIPVALKVAQKSKRGVKAWYDEMGKAYMRLAERETEGSRSWIKLDQYRSAIDAFRQSGDKLKKQQVEQLYFELKPKVKLDEFKVDFDEATIIKLKAFQEELKAKAFQLLKDQPERVYATISNGNFFPKYKDIVEAAKNKDSSFLDFVTTIQFDKNKNIASKSIDKNEKQEVLEAYSFRMKETLLPFLHYVIVFGIKSGHLTTRNLLQYLIKYTWVGKPHTKINLGGNPISSNWIFLIAPAIAEFYNQVLAWGESKYYTPNFIVCTDSLTLKMEGLFRNFCERIDLSTSIGKRSGVQEVLAHDIFNNEIIRSYFTEDDMLLFDYVFSNEGGLNLRNNIAHCFYNENEYSPDYMLLLIAVLLRLGKYNIKPVMKE